MFFTNLAGAILFLPSCNFGTLADCASGIRVQGGVWNAFIRNRVVRVIVKKTQLVLLLPLVDQ